MKRSAFPAPSLLPLPLLAIAVLALAVLAPPGRARAQAAPAQAAPAQAEPAQVEPAQAATMRRDSFGNLYDHGLQRLKAHNITEARSLSGCPDVRFEVQINYPAATGNPNLDRLFELNASHDRDALFDSFHSVMCGDVAKPAAGWATRRFEAHSPSPGILSVAFSLGHSLVGGDGPVALLEAHVFDVREGAKMELSGVFPDHREAAPALWAAVAEGWCAHPANSRGVLPTFYGLTGAAAACRPDAVHPLPAEIARDTALFSGFGTVFLTAEGLTIRLLDHQAWGPRAVERIEDLSIGKDELIAIGARPEIWR